MVQMQHRLARHCMYQSVLVPWQLHQPWTMPPTCERVKHRWQVYIVSIPKTVMVTALTWLSHVSNNLGPVHVLRRPDAASCSHALLPIQRMLVYYSSEKIYDDMMMAVKCL